MSTLHFGVVDVAYKGDGSAKTTGDVAEILEDKYHIMRSFLELKEDEIADELVNAVAGAIESIAQGKRVPKLDLSPSMGRVEAMFRDFLDSGEMARLLPATQQIAAAVAGVNHRKMTPNAKGNKARQAFVDSGLYQASFRAWVD